MNLNSPQNFAPENGLQSQFAILRALPLEVSNGGRRAVLDGLQWRQGAKRLGPIAVMALLCTLFSVLMIRSVLQRQKVQSVRASVTARVTQSESVVNDFENNGAYITRFLRYRFRVDTREYDGNTMVLPNGAQNSLRVGDTIEVQYNPRDPTQNAPHKANESDNFPWPFFLLLPLLMVPLMWASLHPWLLARQLCAKGTLAQGKIVWIRPRANIPSQNASQSGEVLYRWSDRNGVAHEGVMTCDNFWLMQQWSENTPVIVAFDPKKTARSVILEAFVR